MQVQLVEDVKLSEEQDILRVPSPPQRRLSRSSIDLRDLEQQQQQLQQHDRVCHTDSAPSMIALENFPFKASKGGNQQQKTDSGFFQPLCSKSNFLNKPLECFHTRVGSSNSKRRQQKTTDAIDGTIENDNDDLARFIEDNYQYFKKQNGGIDFAVDFKENYRNLAQIQQACSDSDFLILRNNIETGDMVAPSGACCNGSNGGSGNRHSASTSGSMTDAMKRLKNKKHKMAALSDSDFLVSFDQKSIRKFTLKSKIPFARSILNGKFQKPGKYCSLDQQQQQQQEQQQHEQQQQQQLQKQTAEVTPLNKKGLNNNLSKSLNGCHRKNNETPLAPSKCIQRVLSEGNEATIHVASADDFFLRHIYQDQFDEKQRQQQEQQLKQQQQEQIQQQQQQQQMQQPTAFDTFDMFLKSVFQLMKFLYRTLGEI